MFLNDIARKPFFVRTGRTYGCTDVWTRVMLYAPHYKWRGHKKVKVVNVVYSTRLDLISKVESITYFTRINIQTHIGNIVINAKMYVKSM